MSEAEQQERYRQMEEIPDGGWAFVIDRWYVRPPGSPFAASVERHTVTDHGDGTITVQPSIAYDVEHFGYSYHGYLTAGVWRSV